MKPKSIQKRSVNIVALFIVLLLILVAHKVGYQRGVFDGQIKRIPFDLEIYLQLYEMGNYIQAGDKSLPVPVFRHDNSKVLLYSTIQFLDATKERFSRIATKGTRFDSNVLKARKIVEDLEVVSVGSVIEEIKENGVNNVGVKGDRVSGDL